MLACMASFTQQALPREFVEKVGTRAKKGDEGGGEKLMRRFDVDSKGLFT